MKKRFIVFISFVVFLCGCTVNYYYQGTDNTGTNTTNTTNTTGSQTGGDSPAGTDTPQGAPFQDSADQFIKVHGRELRYPDNSVYQIKSMGLGNDAFGERSEIPYTHHSEASYKELSEMGFNTVRFYLTYKMFETNENPYVYNTEVFEWINDNIEWAKKYNMHIILDMHTPQGGYQPNGEGLALFTDESNQQRLVKLWGKIASYYENCSTILGFDLVNEPQVPFDTDLRTSVEAWTRLAQACINEIRSVDTNHIIFAERISGIRPWQSPLSADPVYCYPEVTDDNLVFQAHYYGEEPFNYTHQGADWGNYKNVRESYPRIERIGSPVWKAEATVRFDSITPSFPTSWTRRTYTLSSWNSSEVNAVRLAIKTGEIGYIGSICIDKASLTKVYPDGARETLEYYDFDTAEEVSAWNFGGEEGVGGRKEFATERSSEGTNGFIRVSGTHAHSWVTAPDVQRLEEGCSYIMNFYVRFENQTSSYGAFGFDLEQVQEVVTFGKNFIDRDIRTWQNYPAQQNKPLFIGEFGCFHLCFERNCGVEQYLKDCADVFKDYTCGYNYHVYHENNFGLHLCDFSTPVSNNNLNRKLYNILCQINR